MAAGNGLPPPRRVRLMDLLRETETGLALDELADIMEMPRGAVIDDLKHVQLTLRHRDETLLMAPPVCDACGFTFKPEAPKAPSKCPACKSVSVTFPVFRVARAEG